MKRLEIIYDGQCLFCASYVRMLRLRGAVGAVELIDARSGDPRVRAVRAAGFDLDAGMVVIHGGMTLHGQDAMHMLALLSEPGGMLGEIQRRVFRSPRGARLYPLLVRGRRLLLWLRGRPPIGPAADNSPPRE